MPAGLVPIVVAVASLALALPIVVTRISRRRERIGDPEFWTRDLTLGDAELAAEDDAPHQLELSLARVEDGGPG